MSIFIIFKGEKSLPRVSYGVGRWKRKRIVNVSGLIYDSMFRCRRRRWLGKGLEHSVDALRRKLHVELLFMELLATIYLDTEAKANRDKLAATRTSFSISKPVESITMQDTKHVEELSEPRLT